MNGKILLGRPARRLRKHNCNASYEWKFVFVNESVLDRDVFSKVIIIINKQLTNHKQEKMSAAKYCKIGVFIIY